MRKHPRRTLFFHAKYSDVFCALTGEGKEDSSTQHRKRAKVRKAQQKALRLCTGLAMYTQLLHSFKIATLNSYFLFFHHSHPLKDWSGSGNFREKGMYQILQIGWIKGVTVKWLNGISWNSWKTRMSETYRRCRARCDSYRAFVSIFVYTDEQWTSPTRVTK